jgi:hypothetical protein
MIKRLVSILCLVVLSLPVIAQTGHPTESPVGYMPFVNPLLPTPVMDSTSIARYLPMYASAPNCVRKGQLYYDTGTDKARYCSVTGSPGTWNDIGTSGGPISATTITTSGRISAGTDLYFTANSQFIVSVSGTDAHTMILGFTGPSDGNVKPNAVLFGAASDGAADTGVTRNAAGAVEFNNGTPGTFRDAIGRSFNFSATKSSSSPALTVGSGTGITVNAGGEIRETVYKVTIASTAFVCAATTCDVTVATLPAKTQITAVMADLTTTYACASVCTTSTLSMVFGRGAGGSQWLASFDADASTAQFGDADAELGTTMTRATAIQAGSFESWSSTQAAVLRLTSGTGNIGNGAATNLSQGSVTIYLRTTVFP